jgi:acyl-CoA thioesterase FadM
VIDQPAWIHERRITFADTDAAGVAHFSRLASIVEEAIHAFFLKREIPVFDASTAWPIVSLVINYSAPLKFGDHVRIVLAVQKIGASSLTWAFEVYKTGCDTPAFHGTLTQCHLTPETGRPAVITDQVRALLKICPF